MTVEEFKVTELGLLLKEWDVIRLGELIEEVREKNKSNFQYPVFTVSNVHGFMLSDDFFDKRVYSKKLDTYKIVRSDYFAYNPYRVNVGSIALFDHEVGLVSPAYVVFRVSKPEHLHPPFLYKLIKSPHYLDEIRRIAMSRGSVRRSLSFSDLSDFRIPLPPLPEQEKIAYVLSTVQTAIEKAAAIINTARELKKSLMKHLFTYGPVSINEAENVPLKETEVGLVSEEWEVERLGDSIKEAQYGLSLRGITRAAYPILRMNNLVDGQINTSNLQYVDLDEVTFKHFKLEKGDILFNRTNSHKLVGKTALFDSDRSFVFASYLIRVVPESHRLLPHYLNHYLNWSETQTRLRMLASRGVSQSNVSATKLRSLLILRPPIRVQQSITENLCVADRKIQVEENEKKALEVLFKTMLSNLMTGKIRANNLEVSV